MERNSGSKKGLPPIGMLNKTQNQPFKDSISDANSQVAQSVNVEPPQYISTHEEQKDLKN